MLAELAEIVDKTASQFGLKNLRRTIPFDTRIYYCWTNDNGTTLSLGQVMPLSLLQGKMYFEVSAQIKGSFYMHHYPAEPIYAATLPFVLDLASFIPYYHIGYSNYDGKVLIAVRGASRAIEIASGGNLTVTPELWQLERETVKALYLYTDMLK